MKAKMTRWELKKWLDRHAKRDKANPWRSYESAKRVVKQNLCNSPDGFDWHTYDYYLPFITEWAGVYDDTRIAR